MNSNFRDHKWLDKLETAYRNLDEVSHCIEHNEMELNIAINEKNKLLESNCLGNLGTAYKWYGRFV